MQVTATPYSIYLQPENIALGQQGPEFRPIKPAFTVLVPIHDQYVGGETYFGDNDEGSVAYFLFEEVPDDELRILKKADRRSFKIEDILTSGRVVKLREAILNFIVGGCLRRVQDRAQGLVPKKYSFIIHTEQAKKSHDWQRDLVHEIMEQLGVQCEAGGTPLLKELVDSAYQDMVRSVALQSGTLPSFTDVWKEVVQALRMEYVMTSVVNSGGDVNQLLDDTGQLKLVTPLNIFIGGQILDRGITVGNLIGFYYGRQPQRFQQDTVLQHSRMYGARPPEDLAVTRFYTTAAIYKVMQRIHEFDSALREAFESGRYDHGVIFIEKDASDRIVPCSPNKLLLSKTTSVKPSSRLLPVGFQMRSKTHLIKAHQAIEDMLSRYPRADQSALPFRLNFEDAIKIVECIESTFKEGHDWDHQAFIAAMRYMMPVEDETETIWALARRNREIRRTKQDGRPAF